MSFIKTVTYLKYKTHKHLLVYSGLKQQVSIWNNEQGHV